MRRLSYALILFFGALSFTSVAQTLTLNLEICSGSPTEVRMTGPFWSWDLGAGPVATDNMDGTWTVVLDPAPGADMEYLWIVDGVQENLISEAAAGFICTPVTDGATFANRQWTVASGVTVINDAYNQCLLCSESAVMGCTDSNANNYDASANQDDGSCTYDPVPPLNLTVDVCGATPSEVRITGPFWSWDAAAGPTATDNMDGTWTVTLDPAPTADMEYLWILDGAQENLLDNVPQDLSCTPVTDGVGFANRQWTVGSGDVTGDIYDSCTTCPAPATGNVNLTFDDAASVNPWAGVGDGTSAEASIAWNASGNGTGALELTATNPDDGVGKAYIFEYLGTGIDLTGGSNWTLTFDVLTAGYSSAALHLQTDIPGVGVTNTFDLQTQGINDATWTPFSYDFSGVSTGGTTFKIHFNIAAGAIVGAGGTVLIDNIVFAQTAGTPGCMDSNATNYDPSATLDDGSCTYPPVSLTVDLCGGSATEVRMTGPFWSWDIAGGPVAMDNMDGTWTVTLDPAPTADMEYLWIVDGTQENLLDNMPQDFSCTPVTDGSSFANRRWQPGDGDVSDVYDSCAACPSTTGDINLTFDDPASITPWSGVADATNPEASIAWNAAGNGTGAMELTGVNPDNGIGKAYIFEYSDTGIDYSAGANWTLTFDVLTAGYTGAAFHLQTNIPGPGTVNNFDLQAQGINDATWTSFSYDFSGVDVAANSFYMHFQIAAGAVSGAGGTVLVDNIVLTPTVATATYNVTFQVDMNDQTVDPSGVWLAGSFNAWSATANQMDDSDGDGIYTATLALNEGETVEFKYLNGNSFSGEEGVPAACGVDNGLGAYNRSHTVGSADETLDVVCFNQCAQCSSALVTFQVDMNEYTGPETISYINVSGAYNAWCADCNQLTDGDGDGVWTGTFAIPAGGTEFKYQINGWADQETLTDGDACTITNGDGNVNRYIVVENGVDQVLDVVCFGSCYACQTGETPGCTDDSANNYDMTATVNDGSCLYDVTFRLNVATSGIDFTADAAYIFGEFNSWCGGCAMMADDDGMGNFDDVWELTIELQAGSYEYKYAADAGNVVQEDVSGAGAACTVTNFGFTNRFVQVQGDAVLDIVCWESCSDCVAGEGCTDATANNYDAAAIVDNGSCLYNVTFTVDMSVYGTPGVDFTQPTVNGSFNGWNGTANPLSDPEMDNIWTATLELTAGDYEYQFAVDNWADQEFDLDQTGGCNLGANRFVNISGQTDLGVVCWELCTACPGPTTVTFRVDMANQTVSPDGVTLAIDDSGLTYYPMTYLGWGIYEAQVSLQTSVQWPYQFINGGEMGGSAEVVPAACETNGYRTITPAGNDSVLFCFSECAACDGCTDPLSTEYNPFAGNDDGSCATALVYGCTYADAENYDMTANTEDGSCTFAPMVNDCPSDLDGNGSVGTSDLLAILGDFGIVCP